MMLVFKQESAIAEYITVLLLRESLSGGPPLLSALETNSPKLARDAAPALLLAGLTGGCRVVGRTTMASRSLRAELIEEPPEEPPALLMDERWLVDCRPAGGAAGLAVGLLATPALRRNTGVYWW